MANYDMKTIALVVLVIQNSATILMMKFSRSTDEVLYITSTAVVCSELMKLIASLILTAWEAASEKLTLKSVIQRDIIDKPEEMLKLCVPAILYTIQNNLGYVAVNNLSAAALQVTYQLKILTTAALSVIMLGKSLNSYKWISLFILVIGVAIVQISNLQPPSTSASGSVSPDNYAEEEQSKGEVDGSGTNIPEDVSSSSSGPNALIGLIAILTCCCSSGFAGVYFEKVLKGSNVSVWVRNIQLSLIGLCVGLFGVYWVDFEIVNEGGFFLGYNPIVWCVISLQALGGLVVAVVVKYADNLLKGFATSISIVLSCIISYFLFNFEVNSKFVVGTFLVLSATVMYSLKDFLEFKEMLSSLLSLTSQRNNSAHQNLKYVQVPREEIDEQAASKSKSEGKILQQESIEMVSSK